MAKRVEKSEPTNDMCIRVGHHAHLLQHEYSAVCKITFIHIIRAREKNWRRRMTGVFYGQAQPYT